MQNNTLNLQKFIFFKLIFGTGSCTDDHPDDISIVVTEKSLENLVYITSTGFSFLNETWVTDPLPADALVREPPAGNVVVLGLCNDSFYGYKCNEGQGLIVSKTMGKRDYLIIAGYTLNELQDAVDHFINNDVKEDLILEGLNAVKMKDYIEEDKSEVEETIKCKGISYETGIETTKSCKFGICETHSNELQVMMKDLQGTLSVLSDKPFEAKLGIDWLDVRVNIHKGDCFGEIVTVVNFHQKDGVQKMSEEFSVPEKGCYCLTIKDEDMVIDNAKIKVINPPFTINFSTN